MQHRLSLNILIWSTEMKVKTSEAEDQVLDYLVAKCEQGEFMDETWWADFSHESCYSTDWEEGGLIIEREKLELVGYTMSM
jgi:hypothetical protein